MKHMFILFKLTLSLLTTSVFSQSNQVYRLQRDSVCIDSVQILNDVFFEKIIKFHKRNIKSLDSSSYFIIENLAYKDNDPNSFIVIISIGKDFENDLMGLNESSSCYFKVQQTLVLVRFLESKFSLDLLFKRTSNNKKFFFNQRKYEAIGNGISSPTAGHKVTIKANNAMKVKRLYYFDYPYSKIQKCYYKIRHCNYF